MERRELALIVEEAQTVFAEEACSHPLMSLRAGNAADSYETQPPYSELEDRLSDEYLETNYWGIAHLDPQSFKHYLPALIEYSLRNIKQGSNLVDTLLFNLRPPDREPPRLAAMSPAQEALLVKFLDALAFSEESVFRAEASIALEEWWAPGALYRTATK